MNNELKERVNNMREVVMNLFEISEEEMNRRLGVTEDDLSGFDEVEIE